MRNVLLRQKRKDRDSGKEPALMKGAGGGTIEKIQNKNGGSPAESIRGTAAIIFFICRAKCAAGARFIPSQENDT